MPMLGDAKTLHFSFTQSTYPDAALRGRASGGKSSLSPDGKALGGQAQEEPVRTAAQEQAAAMQARREAKPPPADDDTKCVAPGARRSP